MPADAATGASHFAVAIGTGRVVQRHSPRVVATRMPGSVSTIRPPPWTRNVDAPRSSALQTSTSDPGGARFRGSAASDRDELAAHAARAIEAIEAIEAVVRRAGRIGSL